MPADRAERLYRLDPVDTSGIFLGLGVTQCALLAGGLVIGVLAMTSGASLAVAAAPVIGSAAVAFARLGGHPAWEWIGLGAGWVRTRVGRRRTWRPRLPLLTVDGDHEPVPMPPCLTGITLSEVPWRGRLRLGVIEDEERGLLTAVVRATGPQFVVEARTDQERLLSGWGDVLNQFAVERTVVTHLTWCDLSSPSGLGEHQAWLRELPVRPLADELRMSYEDLIADASTTASSHDVLVTISVDRSRLTRRHLAGDGDEDRLARALGTSVETLLRGLRVAGLSPSDPLTMSELQRVVRQRIDPTVEAGQQGVGLADRLALSSASAAPMAMDVGWRHIRVDGSFHRTFHVAAWPRLSVPPAWLEPFLAAGGTTRTMTVVLTPVPTHQSRRQIERDLVKLDSDAATKEDNGRRIDARHRRATQSLLEREEEIVAGYSEVGYIGLVTVTAPSLEELDDHAEVVEQVAREVGLELRCLDGRQDMAWAAALPLGLAPATLLA
jgi:hypothetical protein